jgi:hypothetical protein
MTNHRAQFRSLRRMFGAALILPAAVLAFVSVGLATAQAQGTGIEIRGPVDDVPQLKDIIPDFNTTVIPGRRGPLPEPTGEAAQITLEARLIENSPALTEDVVWRIFQRDATITARPRLLQTHAQPRPTLSLAQGTYYVSAAFGRAHLTKRLTVLARTTVTHDFVLNAGGLRADVSIEGGRKPTPQEVRIRVYSDESDQSGERPLVISDARPGDVIRLNAGLYHLESRLGKANAVVRSEVSVEAGKLTIAQVRHLAATVTLKLVQRAGGEAIARTRWAILSKSGDVLSESVGALPSHVLAPGPYTVTATTDGRTYRREFSVATGRNIEVEVVAR